MDPNLIGYAANGSDVSPGIVYRPVPGLLLAARGRGDFSLDHPGSRGTIEAEIVTGALGAGATVLQLQTSASATTHRIRIDLNDSNRPEFAIFNGGGSAVTSWTPAGADIPAGTALRIRLVWDSRAPLSSGLHVSFTAFDGSAFEGDWDPLPTTPWVMGPMQTLLSGYSADGEFNGTIRLIQVGTQT